MRWERDLEAALRELARSVEDVPENPAGEQRLLEVFDARVQGKRGGLPHKDLRWLLAAAASLVLVAGGWWAVSQRARPGVADPVTAGGVARVQRPVTGPGAVPGVPTPPAEGAGVSASRPPKPSAAARPAPARRARPSTPAVEAASDSQEFLVLPAADRLPRFESGVIVRVELDVTSLPAFGLPIMPDSTQRPVTADVLVGQDGQPRAIRLVGMQSQRRRP